MNREKKLIKNTMIISIGKICAQLITFLLLPLYTYILSTEEYGIIDLINILTTLFIPIITLEVEQAVFRELIENRYNESNKTSIISNGFFSIIFEFLLCLIIFSIAYPFINNDYKILLIVNIIIFSLFSYFQQIARGLGNNQNYTIGSFINAILTIIFNIIFLLIFKMHVIGMILGNIIGQLISIIYLIYSLRLYKYISIKYIKFKEIKKLWKYSIPLVPNTVSWWIFNASDKVIVSTILGLSATGILSASHKFSGLYISIYAILNLSWTEAISLNIKDKDISSFFGKNFNIIINLFSGILLLLIAFMPIVFPILINTKFNNGYNLVPILLIASLFNVLSGLMGAIYVAQKNTKNIAIISIITAIINILMHLSLVNYIGLYAAAISTLVSFIIMTVYRYIDINKKYFRLHINKKLIINSITCLPIILFCYYKNSIILTIISIFLAIISFIVINLDILKIMFNLFKSKALFKK